MTAILSDEDEPLIETIAHACAITLKGNASNGLQQSKRPKHGLRSYLSTTEPNQAHQKTQWRCVNSRNDHRHAER